MLIKFFKSSFLIQYFMLVVITAVLWIPGFLRPQEISASTSLTTPLYNLIHPLLVILQPYNPVIAYVIVLVSGLTLNNILAFCELTPKNNLLPAFLFTLLMSSNPLTLSLYPFLLTIPLFTWFLYTIYRVNDEPENNLAVFNASMILSVISMIYFPAVGLFVLLWLILLVFGTFSGRNIIITFIGFFLPYLYLIFYYFWTDNLIAAAKEYRDFFLDIFQFSVQAEYYQYGIWGYFFCLILSPAFFKITGALSSYNINLRKKMGATSWFLVFAVPLVFLSGQVQYNLVLFIPASISIAHYFNSYKRSAWNEIVLLLFLILTGFHNYLHL